MYVVFIGAVFGYFIGRRWEREYWRDCIRIHTNDVNWSNGHKVSLEHDECAHSIVDHIYDIRKFGIEYVDIQKYGEKKLTRNGLQGNTKDIT